MTDMKMLSKWVWGFSGRRVMAVGLVIWSCFMTLPSFGFRAFGEASTKPGRNSLVSKPDKATQERLLEAYGRSPLLFEANEGQTDRRVKFLSRGSGYNLFLTENDAVLVLNRRRGLGVEDERLMADSQSLSATLHIGLVNANRRSEVLGLEEVETRSNYFVGKETDKWRSNIKNYARVQYKDVYPGIDLTYYGNQSQLEYDFIVSPGADPNRIEINFEGADRIEVDEKGDLLLYSAGNQIRQHKPVIYQENKGVKEPVSGKYILKEGRRVGFQLGGYDQSRKLIIDPVLSYSTFLGGMGFNADLQDGIDQGNSIAIDANGTAYITGFTTSFDFPVVGSPLSTINGSEDIFVARVNQAGTALVYSTYLGGEGRDIGLCIAVDSASNAYVAGSTTSFNFPRVVALQSSYRGGTDGFIFKLNPLGNTLLFSTYLGGTGTDRCTGLVLDSGSNVVIAGGTSSPDFPIKSGFQKTINGFNDGFVTKLSSTGSLIIYSTFLGGSNTETINGIAIDSTGSPYVTGNTSSTDFPTMNPLQPSYNGGTDAFVTKLNVTGSALVYSTYIGGGQFDNGTSIAVDAAFNAYVTGTTGSEDFPTKGPIQGVKSISGDIFVAKLNKTGVLAYSTYLGGNSLDEATGIAVDSTGSAYVTGRTLSTDFPTANPLQASTTGISDIFISKLNPAGSSLIYSTYFGGSSTDDAFDIAIDSNGNVYITGSTTSTNFPTLNPVQSTNSGSTDAFVIKINAGGNNLIYSTYLGGKTGKEEGSSIAVDSAGNAYITGITSSLDFFENFRQAFNTGTDIFIVKIDSSGNFFVYVTFLSGKNNDRSTDIAVDAAGNAYVTGQTFSLNFPIMNALQPELNHNGDADAFVTKLNATGDGLIYSTYLGGNNIDSASGIAIDSDGNAYLVGNTLSTDFPTSNALQAENKGNIDAFVTKLNTTGSALVYSTYFGGSDRDEGADIAVDTDGNVYVAGTTSSTNLPTMNALQSGIRGKGDAFVFKLNMTGSGLIYSTYLGGSNIDNANGIAVDSDGNACVIGNTFSFDFPTANAMQPTSKGGGDIFVTKLKSAGNGLVYSTYLGGTGSDQAKNIVLDLSGNAYLTGFTNSSNFPLLDALQTVNKGKGDAFVTKLNVAGLLVFSSYLGGSDVEIANGIAIIPGMDVYVTGRTASPDFPTVNAIQDVKNGSTDVFITRLNLTGTKPSITSVTPVAGAVGTVVTISGSNLSGVNVVLFKSAIANPITFISPTSIKVTVPLGAKTGKILVANQGGNVLSPEVFKVQPKILSFTPGNGIAGDSITITGTNFGSNPTVKFGSMIATITSATDTEIVTTVPSGATTGKINITNEDGTAGSATDFIVIQPPTVNSFTPAIGPVGTNIIISGTNLSGVSDVQFNGTSASPITVVTANSLRITVPAGATTGKISVTNRAGTATSTIQFKVLPKITAFTPSSGIAGENVTITGTNLKIGNTNPVIRFGAAVATLVSSTDIEIVATIPISATTGKISVVTADGTAISPTDFIVIKPPTISSLSPAAAPVGTSVLIAGTNLSSVTDVQFNGTTAGPITTISATSIRVNVPAGATTGKISLTNRAGTATSTAIFKVTPKLTAFNPSSALPGETITITGSNFTGATAVRFVAIIATPFTVDSDSQITVKVPATAITGKVSVTTPDGTGFSADNFIVIKQPTIGSFSPLSGKVGAVVTISGSNLSALTDVQFGGTSVTAPIIVVTPASIKVTVPTGATTGKISVVNRAGTATSVGTFTVLP